MEEKMNQFVDFMKQISNNMNKLIHNGKPIYYIFSLEVKDQSIGL